jgi:hypothetical protein
MTAQEEAYRYTFAIMEAPWLDTAGDAVADADLSSAFASFASTRVGVSARYARLLSALGSYALDRSTAWSYTARLGKIGVATDPGEVDPQGEGGGALPGIVALGGDENTLDDLDVARFTTLRTIPGLTGHFVTNGRMMAAPGSDFTYVQNRRVLDVGAAVGRAAILKFLNGRIATYTAVIGGVSYPGAITEQTARAIETDVRSKMLAALVQIGQAQDCKCEIDRTTDVLATSTIAATMSVKPFGYAKFIGIDIGFSL